jgi:mono/diheme cytochrome c family protein/plastocyanin
MKRRELFARFVVALVVLGLPAALFVYQTARQQRGADGVRVIALVARAPELGGFSPDRLTLRAGETVRLRISSPDVVHGLTIPGLGVDVAEILPGTVVEVDVTPAEPGRYAFACTRWCSVDHWRMRGVIEVTDLTPRPLLRLRSGHASLPGKGVANSPPLAGEGLGERSPLAGEGLGERSPLAGEGAGGEVPLYQQLGIDIDAMRHAAQATPAARPSIGAGAELNAALPPDLADPARRRTRTPAGAFLTLRADPANAALSDDDVWSLVAWAWLKDVKPAALARGQTLYARDCAACHGPDGRGKGPAGVNLPGMAKMDPAMPKGPSDFTDAGAMLAASDALLQGKLLRGGMGTGMPEFGSLYSDEEQWAMIAYLRTFLFGK